MKVEQQFFWICRKCVICSKMKQMAPPRTNHISNCAHSLRPASPRGAGQNSKPKKDFLKKIFTDSSFGQGIIAVWMLFLVSSV